MFKKRFKYKGYRKQQVSSDIVLLYVPKAKIGTTHHALSFDNGKTWGISGYKKDIIDNFEGSLTDAVDVCVMLNEGMQNEKQ